MVLCCAAIPTNWNGLSFNEPSPRCFNALFRCSAVSIANNFSLSGRFLKSSSFCFEISAKNNRGISQLFETINRRLVEQHYNKQYQEMCKNEKGYYQERLYNTRDLQGKTVSLDRDSETQDYQSFGSRCC